MLYFDDEFTEGEKRAARDENGNSALVDDMSYKQWKEKYVDKGVDNLEKDDIMKLQTDGFNGDKMIPLDTDKLPKDIVEHLEKLQIEGDILALDKKPTLKDLSLLSRQTGVEFAVLSVNNRYVVIRGSEKATNISLDLLKEMEKCKGLLECHSHPYIGDVIPSVADINVARVIYWQDNFKIVSVDGKTCTYNKNGIIGVGTVENIIRETDKAMYERLFEEVD